MHIWEDSDQRLRVEYKVDDDYTNAKWASRCVALEYKMRELYKDGARGYASRGDMATDLGWTVGCIKKTIQKTHDLGIGPDGLKVLPFDLGHDGKFWYSTRDRPDVIDARQIHGHAAARGIYESVDRAAEIKAGLGYDKKAIEIAAARVREFDENLGETRPYQLKELQAAEREQRKLETKKQKKRNKKRRAEP